MNSIGGGLGRWEKTEQGNLCDWMKRDTYLFYIGGHRIVNIHST